MSSRVKLTPIVGRARPHLQPPTEAPIAIASSRPISDSVVYSATKRVYRTVQNDNSDSADNILIARELW